MVMEKALKQKLAVVGVIAVGALALPVVRRDRADADANADANANANDEHPQESPEKNEQDAVKGPAAVLDGNPRAILNRLWFDKLPRRRSDETDMWIFFSGGIGLEDKGSYFRSTFDLFELERQKDSLDIVFLHDKKKAQTKFTVKSCDEKPPFDLCLVLDTPLKGVSKLYSWGDDDDMDRFVPWGSAAKRSALERARAGSEH
jgi:hypothetical protein